MKYSYILSAVAGAVLSQEVAAEELPKKVPTPQVGTPVYTFATDKEHLCVPAPSVPAVCSEACLSVASRLSSSKNCFLPDKVVSEVVQCLACKKAFPSDVAKPAAAVQEFLDKCKVPEIPIKFCAEKPAKRAPLRIATVKRASPEKASAPLKRSPAAPKKITKRTASPLEKVANGLNGSLKKLRDVRYSLAGRQTGGGSGSADGSDGAEVDATAVDDTEAGSTGATDGSDGSEVVADGSDGTETGATDGSDGTEVGATDGSDGTGSGATDGSDGTGSGATDGSDGTETGATDGSDGTEVGATDGTDGTETGATDGTETGAIDGTETDATGGSGSGDSVSVDAGELPDGTPSGPDGSEETASDGSLLEDGSGASPSDDGTVPSPIPSSSSPGSDDETGPIAGPGGNTTMPGPIEQSNSAMSLSMSSQSALVGAVLLIALYL